MDKDSENMNIDVMKGLPSESNLITYRPKSGLYYFNPKCDHERTSFDLMNCNACVAFSVEREQQKMGKNASVEVSIVQPTPQPSMLEPEPPKKERGHILPSFVNTGRGIHRVIK